MTDNRNGGVLADIIQATSRTPVRRDASLDMPFSVRKRGSLGRVRSSVLAGYVRKDEVN